MRHTGLFLCIIVALAMGGNGGPLDALAFQQGAYNIQGQVRRSSDQSGIAGAIVSLEGPQSRQQKTTDHNGRFRFMLLPPGTYTLEVTAMGYNRGIERYMLINDHIYEAIIVLQPEENKRVETTAASRMVTLRQLRIPQEARDAFSTGADALYKDKPRQSLEHFQKALELYPEFDEAYVQLGIAYSFLDDDQNAVANFKRAVKVYDKNSRAYAFWGKHDYGLGRYEEAVVHLSRAVELDDYFWLAHKDLSRALGRLNRWEEALTHASRAHDLYTEDPDVHLAYYNACVNQGDYPKGLAELDEFVKLFPKHSATPQMKNVKEKLAEAVQRQN